MSEGAEDRDRAPSARDLVHSNDSDGPPEETDVGAEGPRVMSLGYSRPNMAEIEGATEMAEASEGSSLDNSQANIELLSSSADRRSKVQQNIVTETVRDLYHNQTTWRILKGALVALVILRIIHGFNLLEGSMWEPYIPFRNVNFGKLREYFRY